MKMTMREAILNGDDFEFDGYKYKCQSERVADVRENHYESAVWILENQDKLVEVEDNYWDEDGRAIRELEVETNYWYISDYSNIDYYECKNNNIDAEKLKIGNCFKDRESAQAHLDKLKQEQLRRMKEANCE